MAANIKPKNNQDAFDKVLKAIRKQHYQRSAKEGFGCMYRGLNGLRCAAGHLIPDDLYNPEMEGKCISSENEVMKPVQEYMQGLSLNLLQRLQTNHDFHLLKGKQQWELIMKRTAEDYDLVYTEPSKELV